MPTPPDCAYLVLATPRSGSTVLCEMLRGTGVAGVPLEHFEVLRHSSLPRQPREYFPDGGAPDVLAPLDPGTPTGEAPADWWARILREGTGANGVWGGKLMWGHTGELLERTRALADGDLAATLSTLLGEPRLLLVVREDKVAQAVSLWRAVQTQTWRGGSAASDDAVYDVAAIDHLRAQLEADEAAWRAWLAANELAHHEVRYSELAADPAAVVAGALEAIGLPGGAVGAPPLERQSDGRSREWAERYRSARG